MLYVFEHNSIKTTKPDEASFTTLKMLLRAYYDLQTERTAHFQKLQAYIDQVYLNFDKDCLSLIPSSTKRNSALPDYLYSLFKVQPLVY